MAVGVIINHTAGCAHHHNPENKNQQVFYAWLAALANHSAQSVGHNNR